MIDLAEFFNNRFFGVETLIIKIGGGEEEKFLLKIQSKNKKKLFMIIFYDKYFLDRSFIFFNFEINQFAFFLKKKIN